ncbi:MAG: hypothetical protein ABSG53_00685 [Thermoguttaceae bacterium]|jgi:hypothetical protein
MGPLASDACTYSAISELLKDPIADVRTEALAAMRRIKGMQAR